nr:hypothetical protein [uncultured Ruminococcus sp.]
MKKTFKIIALVLAIAVFALSLCSCRALDEAKENRGIYSDDRLSIQFKGETYRLFDPHNYTIISDAYAGWTQYHATDKELPLLLASWYGDTMSLNREKTVIETSVPFSAIMKEISNEAVNNTVDPQAVGAMYGNNNATYVREDLYEDTKAAAEADKLECYFIEYYENSNFDYDFGMSWSNWKESTEAYSDSYRIVLLEDAVTKIVDSALKTTAKDKISYKELSENQTDISFQACDKNLILRDWDANYYFVHDQGKYYFWDGTTNDEKCMVPLNQDDSEIIDDLFDQYPYAVDGAQVGWSF